MLTAQDVREFCHYLDICTDAQLHGVWVKERSRGGSGEAYAELTLAVAKARGITLEG